MSGATEAVTKHSAWLGMLHYSKGAGCIRNHDYSDYNDYSDYM